MHSVNAVFLLGETFLNRLVNCSLLRMELHLHLQHIWYTKLGRTGQYN